MTEFIPDPDLRFQEPRRGVRSTADANAINAAADAVSTIGRRVEQKRAETKARNQQEAFGNVATDFINLENDIIRQRQAEADIEQQSFEIHRDNVVTPEEQKTLDQLGSRLATLDLLDPAERSLRRNALLASSLNEQANEGIQSQIFNAFGVQREVEDPTANAINAQFEQQLDLQFGKGGWGAVERGKVVAETAYTQQMQVAGNASLANLEGRVDKLAISLDNGLVRMLRNAPGGFSEQARTTYQSAVAERFIAALNEYDSVVAQKRAAGEILDPETVTRQRQEFQEMREFYLNGIFEDEGLGANSFRAKLDNYVKTGEQLLKANFPATASDTITLLSGGQGGIGMQNVISGLLQWEDKDFQAIMPDATASEIAQLRMQVGDMLVGMANAKPNLEKVLSGQFSATFMSKVSFDTLQKVDPTETPETKAVWETAMEEVQATAHISNNSEFIQGVEKMGSLANTVSSKGNAAGAARTKTQVNAVLRSQLERVDNELRGSGFSVDLVGGELVLVQEEVSGGQGGRGVSTRTSSANSRAQRMLDAIQSTYQSYADVGYADMSDLEELTLRDIPRTVDKRGRTVTPARREQLQEEEVLTATNRTTQKGRPVFTNQFGEEVSERTITVEIDGGVYNIPTVYDGKFVDQQEAVRRFTEAGFTDPVTGEKLKKFSSIEQAVQAAQSRSSSLRSS